MNHEIKYILTLFFFFGLGSVIVQSLLVPYITIHVWRPDFVLIIVLLMAKRFGSLKGSTVGFILGILQDSLTAMPIGISALPKALAGYASGKARILLLGGTMYLVFFMLIIFFHELIVYGFMQFKTEVSYPLLIVSRVFPNTIYSIIMLFISNYFLNKYFSTE